MEVSKCDHTNEATVISCGTVLHVLYSVYFDCVKKDVTTQMNAKY